MKKDKSNFSDLFIIHHYLIYMFDFIKKLFLKTDSEPDTMKYLIAGLGNIGSDYNNTRHNVGFDVVEELAKEFGVTFKFDNQAFVAEFKHKGRIFVLIKPTTYMNLSGKAVNYWLQIPQISLPQMRYCILLRILDEHCF